MPRIIITEPGKSPQPYRLKIDSSEITVGRAQDNNIIIQAGSASSYHCIIKKVSGGFIMEDLNSTNGIKTDATPYQVIDLIDNLMINIGDDVTLEFTLTDEEKAELGKEDFVSQQKPKLPTLPAAGKESVVEESENEIKSESNDFEDEINHDDEYFDADDSDVSSVRGSFNSLIFIIFAILALALGFFIRHYQDVLSSPEVKPAVEETSNDASVE